MIRFIFKPIILAITFTAAHIFIISIKRYTTVIIYYLLKNMFFSFICIKFSIIAINILIYITIISYFNILIDFIFPLPILTKTLTVIIILRLLIFILSLTFICTIFIKLSLTPILFFSFV